jgi:hypothetical protein
MLIQQNNRCRKPEKIFCRPLQSQIVFINFPLLKLTNTDMQYNLFCKNLLPAAMALLFFSCNDGTKGKPETPKNIDNKGDTAKTVQKDTGTATTAKRAPAINIFDTLSPKKWCFV